MLSDTKAQMLAIESDPSLTQLEKVNRRQALYINWYHQQQQSAGHLPMVSSQNNVTSFDPSVISDVVGELL